MPSKVYLDLCPSFGCRSSSSACHRVSAAVTFLLAKRGHTCLAFLDDFAECEGSESKAWEAYNAFLDITRMLGLQVSIEKCSEPTQNMIWLGFNIDVPTMTITIPQTKLNQVLSECKLWGKRSVASVKMIRSLIGKLLHLSHCVQPARKFTGRILSTLRYMTEKGQKWTSVPEEFKLDVKWFEMYAAKTNGLSLITPIVTYVVFECDSSLTGGGGHSSSEFSIWRYDRRILKKYPLIHQLEALNLLVGYRTLASSQHLTGKCVLLIKDNLCSSYALMTGPTKDPVLGACARELWLAAAQGDHDIKVQHKHRIDIPLADALSRFDSEPDKRSLARLLVKQRGLLQVSPNLNNCVFFSQI